MELDQKQILDLLRLVSVTQPTEIDCDEYLGHVARYLDVLRRRAEPDVPQDFAQLHHHLAVCPECREEFAALMEAEES